MTLNTEQTSTTKRRSIFRQVRQLLLVVVAMFGFGYLMVPIYDVLCELTGLNGKTGVVTNDQAERMQADESREITVEFIATLNSGANWAFKPEVARMKVHPGRLYTTRYIAENKASQEVVGQAIPSVAPREASVYFNKTECFCFSNQVFLAGERKSMPVTFVVDPKVPQSVRTLTLSYTFFDVSKHVKVSQIPSNSTC